MSNDLGSGRLKRWEIVGFLAIAALMIWDLAVDYSEGASALHFAAELVILVIAAGAALAIWLQLKRTRQNLVIAKTDATRWQEENRELLLGFSTAIGRQFERWGLSEAETEIAFHLLKGLSHKEIARLRDTSERTVREQSRSVYKKSGVQGRAALSAFFLENVMLPSAEQETPAERPGAVGRA